jgi:predicted RND superfamily exporter protein
MSEFADHYEPGHDVKATISRVVDHLYKPMLFTSLTTGIGFASLLITPVPPVQVFGAFVAFGVLLAFLVTIVFIPAYVVRMKPNSLAALGRLKAGSEADTPLANGLRMAESGQRSRYTAGKRSPNGRWIRLQEWQTDNGGRRRRDGPEHRRRTAHRN